MRSIRSLTLEAPALPPSRMECKVKILYRILQDFLAKDTSTTYDPSLHSRRKRGRGRGASIREKKGVLGARDEGTPATKTPLFSSLPTDFQVIQLS